jgi:hypothetical protein
VPVRRLEVPKQNQQGSEEGWEKGRGCRLGEKDQQACRDGFFVHLTAFFSFVPFFFFSVCAAAVCSRLHASLTVPMGFVDVDTGQTREILPMIHTLPSQIRKFFRQRSLCDFSGRRAFLFGTGSERAGLIAETFALHTVRRRESLEVPGARTAVISPALNTYHRC